MRNLIATTLIVLFVGAGCYKDDPEPTVYHSIAPLQVSEAKEPEEERTSCDRCGAVYRRWAMTNVNSIGIDDLDMIGTSTAQLGVIIFVKGHSHISTRLLCPPCLEWRIETLNEEETP